MSRYQSAVRGENGDASSESEDEEGESHVINKNDKEQISFSGLSNLKSQWEQGAVKTQREEIVEMKKEELKRLRQRMCLGRSESMRQVYEKACHEATTPTRSETAVTLDNLIQADKIKEKFEKGQVNGSDITHEKIEKMKSEKEEDLSVFAETGIAHNARSLFKKMDATARTTSPLMSPTKSPSRDMRRSRPNVPATEDVVKCSEPVAKEEINIETKEISQRFKFFENYHEEPKERKRFQMTPPREEEDKREESPEPERDPNVVRCNGTHVDIPVTDTARKMLDKFKALQEAVDRPENPAGPKPLKRITPPRDLGTAPARSRTPSPPRDPAVVRCTDQLQPELPEADTARLLRQKFERWQAEQPPESYHEEGDLMPQIDTAKNLRAKFEAIKEESLQAMEKPKPRVKRFVSENDDDDIAVSCLIIRYIIISGKIPKSRDHG
ncbi:LIMA1 [Cordylochernes scorpioides]|uniref:LIMA1 n=1 Tax=Cordylochernes scorpioides TaxID=51811 RepID=A0ABY6KGC9_9ARAC|nr:LIMA1 [Cordylochernes scorpioides]